MVGRVGKRHHAQCHDGIRSSLSKGADGFESLFFILFSKKNGRESAKRLTVHRRTQALEGGGKKKTKIE